MTKEAMPENVTVAVRLNQQQEQLIQRLILEGVYGSTPVEVIRDIFIRFCEVHPEICPASDAAATGGYK
jgi:hypothetical protein